MSSRSFTPFNDLHVLRLIFKIHYMKPTHIHTQRDKGATVVMWNAENKTTWIQNYIWIKSKTDGKFPIWSNEIMLYPLVFSVLSHNFPTFSFSVVHSLFLSLTLGLCLPPSPNLIWLWIVDECAVSDHTTFTIPFVRLNLYGIVAEMERDFSEITYINNVLC